MNTFIIRLKFQLIIYQIFKDISIHIERFDEGDNIFDKAL